MHRSSGARSHSYSLTALTTVRAGQLLSHSALRPTSASCHSRPLLSNYSFNKDVAHCKRPRRRTEASTSRAKHRNARRPIHKRARAFNLSSWPGTAIHIQQPVSHRALPHDHLVIDKCDSKMLIRGRTSRPAPRTRRHWIISRNLSAVHLNFSVHSARSLREFVDFGVHRSCVQQQRCMTSGRAKLSLLHAS